MKTEEQRAAERAHARLRRYRMRREFAEGFQAWLLAVPMMLFLLIGTVLVIAFWGSVVGLAAHLFG